MSSETTKREEAVDLAARTVRQPTFRPAVKEMFDVSSRNGLLILFCAFCSAGNIFATPEVGLRAFSVEQPAIAVEESSQRRSSSLVGRHRFGLALGFWGCRESPENPTPTTENKVNNLGGGIVYSHWSRESLAVTLSMTGHVVDLETGLDDVETGVSDHGTVIASILVGARWYPLPPSSFRPYVTTGMGPFIGSRIETGPEQIRSITTGAVGGQVGGGLDAQIGHSFMIGVLAGYNFVADFPTRLAGRDNFSGFTTRIELSFLWGRGKAASGD